MLDAYKNFARFYDRLFDKMNQGLRVVGVRLFKPGKGMNILDVGCGTGSHLKLYQRFGCNLYGIDLSPSMLSFAEKKLGDSAHLELGDATRMPYEDHMFDLVFAMLSLHEMPPETRLGVLSEMKRVSKGDGRILLIEFHPGPYQFLQGWISKIIVFFSELAAGKEHFKNYRKFMAARGLSSLVVQSGLEVEKQVILAGGNFELLLTSIEKKD